LTPGAAHAAFSASSRSDQERTSPVSVTLPRVGSHPDLSCAQYCVSLKRRLDLSFNCRWNDLRLDGDFVSYLLYAAQVEHSKHGGGPMVLQFHLAFQNEKTFLHRYLNLLVRYGNVPFQIRVSFA